MQDGEYSVNLQVIGLFVVMLVSFLGMGVSFQISKLGAHRPGWEIFLVLLKGLGVGIITSTACIHLINEASENFEQAGWAEGYNAWAFVFALFGLLIISVVEFYSHRLLIDTETASENQDPESFSKSEHGHHHDHHTNPDSRAKVEQVHRESDHGHHAHHTNEVSKHVAIVVELGVLCHSLLIGFDLGLQDKQHWNSLVIAVAFHQFFEGLALAQVIVDAKLPSKKVILMTLFFSLTTAVGIALGIAVHSIIPRGATLNIVVGILNSLCGGIILYIGLISLFVPWFVNNQELIQGPVVHSLVGFSGIAVGFAIMAVIGIWT
mmetsp:Transcript_44160/g.70621  ORF Transcript_44160/g.70621 Transcript_44160/m.70621 type:complete len:321 (-) Transcript_44160:1418-2380(-)